MTDAHSLPEDLLEELLDDYLCWREQSTSLRAAYQRWAHASRADRPAAFAAYVAQLEQEYHAARRYETSARNATLRLTRQPLAPVA